MDKHKINVAAMNPTKRFSDRVENYVKYRPHYPKEIIDFLENKSFLMPNSVVADIGSGTGFLAERFLEFGCKVFGVEPNREMREAGERYLKKSKNFASVDGTAEDTTLEDNSIDLIVAGQAFHWFHKEITKKEFQRIAKPASIVALIWNSRHKTGTPFIDGYERLLLKFCPDYHKVSNIDLDLDKFFGYNRHFMEHFTNFQEFDVTGLKGRLLSSSYTLAPDHPDHMKMMEELTDLFDDNEIAGKVRFEYTTEIIYGHIIYDG